jgi:hypothetical protein
MWKLSSVASIVVDVGEACRTRNLREESLPVGLRMILVSLCAYVLRHGVFRDLTE